MTKEKKETGRCLAGSSLQPILSDKRAGPPELKLVLQPAGRIKYSSCGENGSGIKVITWDRDTLSLSLSLRPSKQQMLYLIIIRSTKQVNVLVVLQSNQRCVRLELWLVSPSSAFN